MTSYSEQYWSNRKAYSERVRVWLNTSDGTKYKKAIDRALALDEPQHTMAVDTAWDVAEAAFDAANPTQRMVYPQQ